MSSLSKDFIPLPILGEEPPKHPAVTDLSKIREKLATTRGPQYWRSLEELAETKEFQDYVTHEFPEDAELWKEPISRRTFLKLMGASFAMAFFTGCRKPLELILPYNQQPENIIPGKPLFYASALSFGGYARGVLIENHLGRPTKIEGNPEHPDSLGATDAFMQSAVLTLYDPDRSQVVTHQGMIRGWEDFLAFLHKETVGLQLTQGAGLRVLTETVTSPTLTDQLKRLMKKFPKAIWHQYEPINRDHAHEGATLAFDEVVEPLYSFDQADIILSLDSDFLLDRPGSLRYSRDFAKRRQAGPEQSRMSRLYVAESTPSITGGMADHRLPIRSQDIEPFTRRLAQELGIGIPSSNQKLSKEAERWIVAVARDLKENRRRSLVITGDSQPAAVHALAHAINDFLGNTGHTVHYIPAVQANPVNQTNSLRELVADMKAHEVSLLLILGGNPVYNAPVDVGFAEALAKVNTRVHLSLYEDETSALCDWHIPEAHALESWGDLRAYDGTASIVQPQIEPLYHGKTPYEMMSALLDDTVQTSHDIVHDYWLKASHTIDFESAWRKALHDGIVANTAFDTKAVSLLPGFIKHLKEPAMTEGLEIQFKPDPTIWDGRYANNGWLQELPKPLTKLTWDNAALVSPAYAEELGVASGDGIELNVGGQTLEAPVFILPGQAARTITLSLGYGRQKAGHVGTGAGFNAYAIRQADQPSFAPLSVRRTGKRFVLANTQHHFSMEGRDLVRAATITEFEKNPTFANPKGSVPQADETLYDYSKPKQSDEYAWGMGIDLNMCTGCNACVIACQAENNIPIVGKEQVANGREMHWIRVDRYFKGDLDNPESYNQPVPCMHCEDAPCEVVCPVGATVHSDEGLNEMVYNRCIGTRYCSNNCPYKVRRFNFLNFTKELTGPLKLLQNPDVTVRSRGVMEKCTYCVQRIQSVKITADKEGRAVVDGEIVPACAQACPTRAISFGNLLDKKSNVVSKKADPRNYALLGELNVRPRTTYQAKLKNPNPELI